VSTASLRLTEEVLNWFARLGDLQHLHSAMKASLGYVSLILNTTKNPRPTTQQWAIGRGFCIQCGVSDGGAGGYGVGGY
jgi:hypothetical protein